MLAASAPAHAQTRSDAARDAGTDASAWAEELVRRGREALDAGELARARELFEAAARVADRRVAAQARFFEADAAERALDFRRALSLYESSVALDPGGRYASRALARVEYLRAHGEGDFAPLTALERVRSDPSLASNPSALSDLARRARDFPPGPVRAEARSLVAQAYAGRLNRPAEAIPLLREMIADPSTPPSERRIALDLLGHVRERLGQAGDAAEEQRRLGGDPALVAQLRRHARRRRLYGLALALCALVSLAGVVSVVRALRSGRGRDLLRAWLRPLPLAHIAMLSLGGGLLAHTYDEHDMRPFFALGAGVLLVYLAASAWSLVGSLRAPLRALRALICAAAMLAVSFLAMYAFDQGMLEGIGL